jgi:predicted acyltransferase
MILVNNPGSWSYIYSPLEHAPWHGATPTDLVFPFFLFAVGNALAFVMPKLEAGGNAAFWKKVIRRTLLIFGIGLFLTWWPFVQYINNHLVAKGWEWTGEDGSIRGIRVMGVLQRIALCYFLGSVLIYYLKPKRAFLTGLIILLIYWLTCVLGNPDDPYSLTGWFGTRVDLAVFGEPHVYHGESLQGKPYAFDPEGLVSTLPAVVNVIFGYLVGDYIRRRGKQIQDMPDPAVKGLAIYQTLSVLFIAAVALLFTAYIWNLVFPINKKIWTSSYVVFTTGLATVVLTTLIYAIEVRQARGWWTRFFDVFGKNALFIFALSSFLPKSLSLIRWADHVDAKGKTVYLDPWHWWYAKVCANIPGAPQNGSLAFALSVIILFWAICYWLDKKKIYIKV